MDKLEREGERERWKEGWKSDLTTASTSHPHVFASSALIYLTVGDPCPIRQSPTHA